MARGLGTILGLGSTTRWVLRHARSPCAGEIGKRRLSAGVGERPIPKATYSFGMLLFRARHPETTKFILYLDNAKSYHAAVVQEYLARHPEFHLEFLPAYSPNLNLIERLWKFLRKKAFTRWHQTFEDMEAAVSAVLDHLEEYRDELTTLMTEKFQRHPQATALVGQSVAA
jgi:transposase